MCPYICVHILRYVVITLISSRFSDLISITLSPMIVKKLECVASVYLRTTEAQRSSPCLYINTVFPIIMMKRLWHRHIFILVRWCLYIETATWRCCWLPCGARRCDRRRWSCLRGDISFSMPAILSFRTALLNYEDSYVREHIWVVHYTSLRRSLLCI